MQLTHIRDMQISSFSLSHSRSNPQELDKDMEIKPYNLAAITKRTIDIAFGLIGTIAFLFAYPVLAILIQLESPGPAIYLQPRVGLDKRSRRHSGRFQSLRKTDLGGQIFTIRKFRTMRTDAEKNGPQLCEKGRDSRVTKVGQLLRSTHLDELPQFWNVLKGEMSFIGPRPERPHFTVKYFEKIPQYRERTRLLKPGITGLAQITLGYDDSIESIIRKTKHDLIYRDALFGFRSWIKMESWIIWNTVRYLLNRAPLGEGAAASFLNQEKLTESQSEKETQKFHETQLFHLTKSVQITPSHPVTQKIHVIDRLPVTHSLPVTPALRKPSVGNFMTIDVECWFHAHNLAVPRSEWDLSPTRIIQNVSRILTLLEKHQTKATFFILGWVAERYPDVVRMIDAAGHEIGTHGYYHNKITDLTPDEFEDDLVLSLNTLAKLTNQKIKGHRASNFSIVNSTLWALDILARNGIEYDSSIFPVARKRYGIGGYPHLLPHQIELCSGRTITEIPMSILKLAGKSIPMAGGGYLRLYPTLITELFIRQCNTQGTPAMVYFHPWELDTAQEKRNVGGLKTFQHYVNLDTTEQKLDRLLQNFYFTSVEENLQTVSLQSMLSQNAVSLAALHSNPSPSHFPRPRLIAATAIPA